MKKLTKHFIDCHSYNGDEQFSDPNALFVWYNEKAYNERWQEANIYYLTKKGLFNVETLQKPGKELYEKPCCYIVAKINNEYSVWNFNDYDRRYAENLKQDLKTLSKWAFHIKKQIQKNRKEK